MTLLSLLSLTVLSATPIACPGAYPGHVQGIATDDARNIYWSFTVALVKTDRGGTRLAQVEVPNHHGDLTWVDGTIYVAVNLGAFNREEGHADSWVYAYDDETLELKSKYAVPELVHGAGGITHYDRGFVVVGGLPKGHDRNYAYRYDEDFSFLERVDIASGYTNMGIQTACKLGEHFWFGTYNGVDSLIRVDSSFASIHRFDVNGSYGIAPWDDGLWLRVESQRGEERGTYKAVAIMEQPPVKPTN